VRALAVKPAPAARRYAALGLDRSARPSKSAIHAANDLSTTRQSPVVMHFYSGQPMQFCSGVDTLTLARLPGVKYVTQIRAEGARSQEAVGVMS